MSPLSSPLAVFNYLFMYLFREIVYLDMWSFVYLVGPSKLFVYLFFFNPVAMAAVEAEGQRHLGLFRECSKPRTSWD